MKPPSTELFFYLLDLIPLKTNFKGGGRKFTEFACYSCFLKLPHISNQSANGFITSTDVLESKDKEYIIPNDEVVSTDTLGHSDISCFRYVSRQLFANMSVAFLVWK